jgi:sigma-B regulation protein RsbU (phosphoserine phosphatase)
VSERYVLYVVSGQTDPFQQEIDRDPFVVGRSSTADLSVPDRFMSRQHTRFFQRGDKMMVEDMGSHNGTLINGNPIQEPAEIHLGDILTISSTTVTVRGPQSGEVVVASRPPATRESSPDQNVNKIKRDATMLLSVAEPGWAADDGTETDGELRRYADRLKLLIEVNAALSGSIAKDELLELILDRVFDHLQPEQAAILLPVDGEFRSAARRSTRVVSDGDAFYSRSLVREVVEERVAVLVVDAAADKRFAAAESILASGITALLAAPLLESGDVLGMIVLTSRIHVRPFTEEDLELLGSLASVAAMRIRNIFLLEEAAERRRLEGELKLARRIQEALLPKHLPEIPGYRLLARNVPSRGVSGDYYTILESEDGSTCTLLVADVSGKGMAASLVTASLEALTAGPIETGMPPDEICERVSRRLFSRTPPEKYATAFISVLDVVSGSLSYTNAGHNSPLVVRRGGEVETLDSTGVPIGLMAIAVYKKAAARLDPGDLLVIYTDGITEAADPDEEEFGMERLSAVCREHRSDGLVELADAIEDALDEFVRGTPFADDRTLVVLERLR